MSADGPTTPSLPERLTRLPGAALLMMSYLISRSQLARRASRMMEPRA